MKFSLLNFKPLQNISPVPPQTFSIPIIISKPLAETLYASQKHLPINNIKENLLKKKKVYRSVS
jgi:hypothetical protein